MGMLNKIFSALVSVLITVVPIIIALHNPFDASADSATAVCALSAAQKTVIRSSLQAFNCSDVGNVTVGSLLGA